MSSTILRHRDELEWSATKLTAIAELIASDQPEPLTLSPRARCGLWKSLGEIVETMDRVSSALMKVDDARVDAAADSAT